MGPRRDRAGQLALVRRQPPGCRNGRTRRARAGLRHDDRRRHRGRRADGLVSPWASRCRSTSRGGFSRRPSLRRRCNRARRPYGEDGGGRGRPCRELQSRRGGRGGRAGCATSATSSRRLAVLPLGFAPSCSRRYDRRSPTSRSSIRTAASAADPSASERRLELGRLLDEVDEPLRMQPSRKRELMVVDSLAEPSRRGTTTGRFPWPSTVMIEPTPA